ncbi:MAG: bifunctional 4-hydroxy-2-oxoglutarate aldolase/2-dehydro-3-deoxy-phosphogluconate aldolase [Planctomycetota bacterium]|nr:bifunctional 4-hydroxy-2-oxoglutarate aldolase/2-dehydro-3-deoxy-phosphogluconate aldolase [Planctomycetota bacterium]MDA1177497.1 bifunctional 4-hydroxy-2-oxoglutarate aldolase/2-dehydro-3-deoxy-phosphogluconate aldolase [Planctomycetota bacterium]
MTTAQAKVLNAEAFVQVCKQERASAIVRTDSQESARKAMDAAVRGGFRIIEFTLSVPGAMELIREFSRRPNLIVGAGTVLTVEQVDEVLAAGATYIVSPVVDEAVIQRAKYHGVASMPGASTPTEMLLAYRAGAPLQKLFPEQGPGPAWVKQTLGPLPFLNIVPTSGVTEANAAAYLKAGAAAVGFVNSLFVPEDIKAGAFDAIENRARAMLAAVRAV